MLLWMWYLLLSLSSASKRSICSLDLETWYKNDRSHWLSIGNWWLRSYYWNIIIFFIVGWVSWGSTWNIWGECRLQCSYLSSRSLSRRGFWCCLEGLCFDICLVIGQRTWLWAWNLKELEERLLLSENCNQLSENRSRLNGILSYLGRILWNPHQY